MSNVFEPHSDKQERLIRSNADITIAGTGTQWGKSQSGALWMKRQVHEFHNRDDNFLIMAPTYKIMRQSTLPYFLHYMRGFGNHIGSMNEFKLDSGGTVFMRTGTDPDSIVGIPKVRAYWLDEANKASLYFHENIQARAAAVGARGLYTSSPYARNWFFKSYIKPIITGKIRDIPLISAASWENPYHTLSDPIKRDEMRLKMDSRRFDMIFGGQWGQMIGLVYDCFDEDENQCDAFQLPHGTRYFGGIDWGYNPDPFVLTVRAITPDGMHYSVSEYYSTGKTISDIIEICRQKKEIFGIQTFYCDPSQPGYIAELSRHGVSCIGADNDINRGIGLHYELIKSRRFKMFRGLNPNGLDELETYHYPDEQDDMGPDDNKKETKPVDQNNHRMDADRYVTISTYRTGIKLVPRLPVDNKKPETAQGRLKLLMKRKAHGQTEDFS